MTNFIFKSNADLQKISQLLEVLLTEQKHQRCDLDILKRNLMKLINSSNLQKQVDEYFDETSPQTEQEEQDDSGNH